MWTITDGHAGNVRQAVALVAALGEHPAHAWTVAPQAPWRWLAPRKFPGSRLAFDREFRRALTAPPALAIGCGRQAALATRLLREHGARAVQILDPRIDPRHWDLVIAPEHDDVRGEIACGPALAQRVDVGADLEEQVGEPFTFGRGRGRHGTSP